MASNMGEMRRMLNDNGFQIRFCGVFLMIFVDCVLIEIHLISNIVCEKGFYRLGEGEGCSICDQVMGILLIGWW